MDAGKFRSDRGSFVEAFGNCFRNGAFLAERAFDNAGLPIADAADVFAALRREFRAASDAEKLEIVKAYSPIDQRIRAARVVTDEHQSVSLDLMTAGQQKRLLQLLPAYVEKFGFDVIFVVRNYTTSELLASFERRILTDHETELSATYEEVERLAEIQVKVVFS